MCLYKAIQKTPGILFSNRVKEKEKLDKSFVCAHVCVCEYVCMAEMKVKWENEITRLTENKTATRKKKEKTRRRGIITRMPKNSEMSSWVISFQALHIGETQRWLNLVLYIFIS